MRTRGAVMLALSVASAFVVGMFVMPKGTTVWRSGSDRDALAGILGSAASTWLAEAEIVAWTPDPNFKPRSYYVVRQMSEDDFRVWAAAAKLRVSDGPGIPSGVFVTPEGVKLTRWVRKAEAGADGLDAQGTTDRAAIWSRWQRGFGFTVVHPSY
jgi:hypothetical protein